MQLLIRWDYPAVLACSYCWVRPIVAHLLDHGLCWYYACIDIQISVTVMKQKRAILRTLCRVISLLFILFCSVECRMLIGGFACFPEGGYAYVRLTYVLTNSW
jgi:hypothetical protein